MTGPKTNERPVLRRGRSHVNEELGTPGTRARARYVRMSAYKARQVLDLIRGHDVERAQEILQLCEREAATVVGKVLGSAMANAEHNDQVLPDELYVSACYADEGPTLKRWRPRARGRATRIRKRTCHITLVVSRLPDDELTRRSTEPSGRRARRAGPQAAEQRRRRVAGRRRGAAEEPTAEGAPEEEPEALDEAEEPAAGEPELAAEPVETQEEAAVEVAEASAGVSDAAGEGAGKEAGEENAEEPE